jgi:hypothetical protein
MELFDGVKTNLMPDTGNTIETIERITSMIKANISHSCRAASARELLCFELVMELPFASESVQARTLSNTNSRANWKVFLIRLHGECTPLVGTLISTTSPSCKPK